MNSLSPKRDVGPKRAKTIRFKTILEIRPGKSACHLKKNTGDTDFPLSPQPGLNREHNTCARICKTTNLTKTAQPTSGRVPCSFRAETSRIDVSSAATMLCAAAGNCRLQQDTPGTPRFTCHKHYTNITTRAIVRRPGNGAHRNCPLHLYCSSVCLFF